MNWFEFSITMVGALGGVETLKYLIERRTNRRRAEALADGDEFRVLRETTEFLQQQLKLKEERFVEQTERLRTIQTDLFEERERRHRAELDLALNRCDNTDCPYREPPNARTPPRPQDADGRNATRKAENP